MTAITEQQLNSRLEKKSIFAATIGTTLEFYDFTLFGFLVPLFAAHFFPNENSFLSTLYGYTVFAVGYLFKPLGAILWGHLGDKFGRRIALYSSLHLMGFSTLLMGLLPTYADIGILAPVCLLLARIVQGLSEGGELAGGLLFALEHTRTKRKGFAGGIFNGICTSGILLGSLAGYVCSLPAMPSWIWRVPFLLGFCIVLFGLYIRKNTTETPSFQSIQKSEIHKVPLYYGIKTEYKQFLGMMLITGLPAVAFHMNFIYLPMYLKALPGVGEQIARLSGTAGLLSLILLLPLAGYLSDKIGQATLMKQGSLLLLALSLFLFSQFHALTPTNIFIGQMLFSVALSMFNGPWCAFASEVFDKRHRYSCIGTANTIGGALFGGTAPLVGTALLKLGNGPLYLGLYIALWCVLGYFAVQSLQALQQKNKATNLEDTYEYTTELT